VKLQHPPGGCPRCVMNVGKNVGRAPKIDEQTLELNREDVLYPCWEASYTQLQR
jgi:hypothetical protein